MSRRLLLMLLIFILSVSFVWAQGVTGNLEGRVLELEGEPIAEANITMEGSHLQGIRLTTTDEQGYFRLLALPVGSYTVKIQHTAFQEMFFHNVTVHLGKTTTLGEIRLKLKVVEEHEVIVTGERPLIDPITTTVGVNLQATNYEVLPTGRDFRSIISLLPQANSSFFGDKTNIAGSTGLENCYFIDGVHSTDPYYAKTSTNLPYNFVKEIEVKQGGYEAEYGRALGGIVNVITYSGGNEFHGNVFGFFTNNRLASEPRLGFLDAKVDEFSTYDVGFSLGGPIVRDKLWFFAAYNKGFENQDIELPGFGFHADKKVIHMFAGKLTWQAAENTNLVFSMFGDPITHHRIGSYPLPSGVPSYLENFDPFQGLQEEGGINFSLQARSFIGHNLLLEAFVARYNRKEILKGDTETGRTEPFFADFTTNTWSGGFGGQDNYRITRTSAKFSATLFLGDHLLKAGIDYEDNHNNTFSETTSPGFIEKYGDHEYSVLYWLADTEVHNRIPSVFLQDSWLVTKRLRLNLGVRWDGQYLIGSDGKTAQSITNQFQPRAGFTFQPGELGTQKIFGSYGRFYQQLPLMYSDWNYAPYEEYLEIYSEDPRDPASVPISRIVIFSPDDPYFPEVKDLEGEHFDEFIVGYERIFADHFKLGIKGIYRTLRQAVGYGIKNNDFFPGNPGKGDLSFLPKPKRNYTALEVTFEKIGGGKLDFHASYVLSRNYGNYAGLYSSDQRDAKPNCYFSLQLEEQAQNSTGLLPNDRPHVFKLFGSYRIGSRLTLGTFFTWQTGTPLNEFGGTSFGFWRYSFLVKRGSAGRTPSIWDLNLRLTYNLDGFWSSKFKNRIILDILHVGSARNAVDIDQIRFQDIDSEGNQILPNPNYGNAMRYQPPMTVRLGIEFGF